MRIPGFPGKFQLTSQPTKSEGAQRAPAHSGLSQAAPTDKPEARLERQFGGKWEGLMPTPRAQPTAPRPHALHRLGKPGGSAIPSAMSSPAPQVTLADLLAAEGSQLVRARVLQQRIGQPERPTKVASAAGGRHSTLADLLAEDGSKLGRATVGTSSPIPPRSAHRSHHINQLHSEIKIDLSKEPLRSIDDLSADQLSKLAKALGASPAVDAGEIVRPEHIEFMRRQLKGVDFGQFAPTHSDQLTRTTSIYSQLPTDKAERLARLAEIAHMNIVETAIGNPRTGENRIRLDLYFGGTQNARDAKQDVTTALGGVGNVYEAACEAALIMAEALGDQAHASTYGVNRICGLSMGGGVAQAFTAALQSNVKLPAAPALILFDPQLLNNAQAKHATRGGKFDYEFDKVRGVAITLDYAKKPHKGLMNIMKSGGYKSPGLVQLRLGLSDYDGWGDSKPQTSGPPGLGYHAEARQYERALWRFRGGVKLGGRPSTQEDLRNTETFFSDQIASSR